MKVEICGIRDRRDSTKHKRIVRSKKILERKTGTTKKIILTRMRESPFKKKEEEEEDKEENGREGEGLSIIKNNRL